MTPVNWRLAPREARYIINDSEAKLLFVGPEFIDAVEAYRRSRRESREIIGMEAAVQGPLATPSGAMRSRRVDPQPDHCVRSAPAVQLYTSGTTGHPKGAVLSHRNFVGMPQSSQDVRVEPLERMTM